MIKWITGSFEWGWWGELWENARGFVEGWDVPVVIVGGLGSSVVRGGLEVGRPWRGSIVVVVAVMVVIVVVTTPTTTLQLG